MEISPDITVEPPDGDDEICINIEGDYHEPSKYIYLKKEQVEKMLELFDE